MVIWSTHKPAGCGKEAFNIVYRSDYLKTCAAIAEALMPPTQAAYVESGIRTCETVRLRPYSAN